MSLESCEGQIQYTNKFRQISQVIVIYAEKGKNGTEERTRRDRVGEFGNRLREQGQTQASLEREPLSQDVEGERKAA